MEDPPKTTVEILVCRDDFFDSIRFRPYSVHTGSYDRRSLGGSPTVIAQRRATMASLVRTLIFKSSRSAAEYFPIHGVDSSRAGVTAVLVTGMSRVV